MLIKVHSVTTHGLKPVAIDVEVQSTSGIPQVLIIGLVGTAVREAKDRIITALKQLNIRLKARRTVISLTPADIQKFGSSFDLAIAVGLISLYRTIDIPLHNSAFIGEVSLDGTVQPVTGCLAKVLAAQQLGYQHVFIPFDNLKDVYLVETIKIYGIKTLTQLFEPIIPRKVHIPQVADINYKAATLDVVSLLGQQEALRALTIAVAGHHHLHLVGPPGAGKSTLPKIAQYLLPLLRKSAALETQAIYSLQKGHTQQNNILVPPFRSPHHSATLTQLLGNPIQSFPGELPLSHNGILFLDELPEFNTAVLRGLRIPLEQKKVVLHFSRSSSELPSNCIVIAASNPCPCGYWNTGVRRCRCSAAERARYINKLSGPLLDRFDLHLLVSPLTGTDLRTTTLFNLENIQKAIKSAHKVQDKRYQGAFYNADLTVTTIPQYCAIEKKAVDLITQACQALRLSTRAYQKTISVAQTIADLEESSSITETHCAEALQYRFEHTWIED